MRLNSKVTWGLAWAGLALVLAVPSADFLTGKMGTADKAALLTSTTEPVSDAATTEVKKTATVTTTRTATGIKIIPAGSPEATDPVDTFIKSGKTLPSYISDGTTTTAEATTKTETKPTQVASIDPAPVLVAPTPFPASARPKAITSVTTISRPADPVVIVDDTTTGDIASIDTGRPVPPAAIPGDGQGWDDESLAKYLENRGLLDDDHSSATVTTRPTATNYDPDGFYLSDGPNGESRAAAERRARLDELFSDQTDDSDTADFTLF